MTHNDITITRGWVSAPTHAVYGAPCIIVDDRPSSAWVTVYFTHGDVIAIGVRRSDVTEGKPAVAKAVTSDELDRIEAYVTEFTSTMQDEFYKSEREIVQEVIDRARNGLTAHAKEEATEREELKRLYAKYGAP